jgi:hypothetical protein
VADSVSWKSPRTPAIKNVLTAPSLQKKCGDLTSTNDDLTWFNHQRGALAWDTMISIMAFIFPYAGNSNPNWQRGWNHQPDIINVGTHGTNCSLIMVRWVIYLFEMVIKTTLQTEKRTTRLYSIHQFSTNKNHWKTTWICQYMSISPLYHFVCWLNPYLGWMTTVDCKQHRDQSQKIVSLYSYTNLSSEPEKTLI